MNGRLIALITVGAVAVVFAAYPFVRFAVKRARLADRIKKLCAERGYLLRLERKRPWLSTNRGERYDFAVETPEKLFYVKLFGVLRRRNALAIMGSRRYAIRKYIAFLGNKVGNTMMQAGGKERVFPDWFSERKGINDKPASNIILVNPVPASVVVAVPGKSERYLTFGEEIDGTAFVSGNDISAYLSK